MVTKRMHVKSGYTCMMQVFCCAVKRMPNLTVCRGESCRMVSSCRRQ
jgi:hypothetical protein